MMPSFSASRRYGAIMASQMKNFSRPDRPAVGPRAHLLDKVGSVVIVDGNATRRRGNCFLLSSTQASLQHHEHGCIPYHAYRGQMGNDVVRGGHAYGMTTTSDGDVAPAFVRRWKVRASGASGLRKSPRGF